LNLAPSRSSTCCVSRTIPGVSVRNPRRRFSDPRKTFPANVRLGAIDSS
jgi:hypothetical protein